MIEADIERYLKRQVEKLGGRCWKLKFISVSGAPDRLVVLPAFQYGAFIELKRTPRTKLEPLQALARATLNASGMECFALGSIQQIDNFIAHATAGQKKSKALPATRRSVSGRRPGAET